MDPSRRAGSLGVGSAAWPSGSLAPGTWHLDWLASELLGGGLGPRDPLRYKL